MARSMASYRSAHGVRQTRTDMPVGNRTRNVKAAVQRCAAHGSLAAVCSLTCRPTAARIKEWGDASRGTGGDAGHDVRPLPQVVAPRKCCAWASFQAACRHTVVHPVPRLARAGGGGCLVCAVGGWREGGTSGAPSAATRLEQARLLQLYCREEADRDSVRDPHLELGH